jgi:hypothetical protein
MSMGLGPLREVCFFVRRRTRDGLGIGDSIYLDMPQTLTGHASNRKPSPRNPMVGNVRIASVGEKICQCGGPIVVSQVRIDFTGHAMNGHLPFAPHSKIYPAEQTKDYRNREN